MSPWLLSSSILYVTSANQSEVPVQGSGVIRRGCSVLYGLLPPQTQQWRGMPDEESFPLVVQIKCGVR